MTDEQMENEIIRLKRIIAKELTENDELGSEYTYVNALREETKQLQQTVHRLSSRIIQMRDVIVYAIFAIASEKNPEKAFELLSECLHEVSVNDPVPPPQTYDPYAIRGGD